MQNDRFGVAWTAAYPPLGGASRAASAARSQEPRHHSRVDLAGRQQLDKVPEVGVGRRPEAERLGPPAAPLSLRPAQRSGLAQGDRLT